MIRLYPESDGSYTAKAKYRDHDGATRYVERTRRTKGAAERALKEAARDRVHSMFGSAEITGESLLRLVAEAWWSEFSGRERSPGTLRAYRDRLDNQILPALGNVRARELSTGGFERFLRTVERRHGSATAKMTRMCVPGSAPTRPVTTSLTGTSSVTPLRSPSCRRRAHHER